MNTAYYVTTFTDGSTVETWGTCAADAGGRALRLRDRERGDRLAVILSVTFSFNR